MIGAECRSTRFARRLLRNRLAKLVPLHWVLDKKLAQTSTSLAPEDRVQACCVRVDELLGELGYKIAVQQIEPLLRDTGLSPHWSVIIGAGRIEGAEELRQVLPIDVGINGPPGRKGSCRNRFRRAIHLSI